MVVMFAGREASKVSKLNNANTALSNYGLMSDYQQLGRVNHT